MPSSAHGSSEAFQNLIPLLIIGLVLLRGARARNLRIERLWVSPVLIMAGLVASLSQQALPGALFIALDVLALIVGAGLGWQRARFTKITIDPQTHDLTSQTSILGVVLIAVIFGVRYVLRDYATRHAGDLHLSVTGITDAFLFLAVGLVCAQRLEIWVRARKMLADARAC